MIARASGLRVVPGATALSLSGARLTCLEAAPTAGTADAGETWCSFAIPRDGTWRRFEFLGTSRRAGGAMERGRAGMAPVGRRLRFRCLRAPRQTASTAPRSTLWSPVNGRWSPRAARVATGTSVSRLRPAKRRASLRRGCPARRGGSSSGSGSSRTLAWWVCRMRASHRSWPGSRTRARRSRTIRSRQSIRSWARSKTMSDSSLSPTSPA
jgi:hypothetical protein